MARRLLWASLALAPVTWIVDAVAHPGKTALFVLSALSLIPLAWLIGEATEHAGEHVGARIGGLLNASFGNAPEVIIALIGQLGLVAAAVLLLLIPSIPGFHGDPNRHSLALISIIPAVALLALYLVVTVLGIRRREHDESPGDPGWSMRTSLVALGLATAGTAVTSEILVHSLQDFAKAAGLSQFFIAFVIVAVVGNAAEHGGAVVIANRGKMKLATQIAITSSAQVGLFVIPVVLLLSFAFAHPLTLAFRPVELIAMGAAAVFVGFVIRDGRSRRWEGVMLIAIYAALAFVAFQLGDR
ncbi:MAG: hypothetical protein AUG91_08885 [Actinobacteria bacterium 13_1_20CM_4_69_9]|nr:MAG: hypothetical protein AUG91_08885 [Actinobacteria bacterium 13_1_20CM_4_69_9]